MEQNLIYIMLCIYELLVSYDLFFLFVLKSFLAWLRFSNFYSLLAFLSLPEWFGRHAVKLAQEKKMERHKVTAPSVKGI